MLWIKEAQMVKSVDDLKSSRSIKRNSWSRLRVARRENCFSTEQNHPEYPLQEKGQSGGTESPKEDRFPSRKTDRLSDLRVFSGHWIQWFCRELCRPVQYQSTKWWYSAIRFEMWRNSTINDLNPMEGLYKLRIRGSEKLKSVVELYKIEIHQKKIGPDCHRLKTMVKKKYRAESANQ